MSQAPRGEVRENVLARLIAPHGDIARKRVTLLYRVIDPGEAARIVERDLHNADFRVNSSARPTARAVVEQQAARATAQEEARGAALVNFGMLVTATVLGRGAAAARGRGAREPRSDGADHPAAGVGLAGLGVRRGAAGRAVPPGAPEGPRRDPAGAMSLLRRKRQAEGGGAAGCPGRVAGPGRARGRSVYLQPPAEWRGTSVQACGLWPFSVGAGAPLIGAPLGKHLLTGATVCGDPISWFQRGEPADRAHGVRDGPAGVRQVELHPADGAGAGRVRGAAARAGRSEARLRRPDRRARRAGDPSRSRQRVSERARHRAGQARRGAPR